MSVKRSTLLPALLLTARELLIAQGLHPTAGGIVQLAHVLVHADSTELQKIEGYLKQAGGLLKDTLKKRMQDLDAAAVVQLGGLLARLAMMDAEEEDETGPAAVQKFLDMKLADLVPLIREGTVSPEAALEEICTCLHSKTGEPAPDAFRLNLLRELMSGAPAPVKVPDEDTMTNEEAQALVDAASPEELVEMLSGEQSDQEGKTLEEPGDTHMGEIPDPIPPQPELAQKVLPLAGPPTGNRTPKPSPVAPEKRPAGRPKRP